MYNSSIFLNISVLNLFIDYAVDLASVFISWQFSASMQKPLSAIVIALASFSEGYGIESTVYRLYSSMVTSGKYLLDPEQRAERVSCHFFINLLL